MHSYGMHTMVQEYQHSPLDSNWPGTKEGISKHTKSMLTMDIISKRTLCEDVREHVIGVEPYDVDGYGALLDEVADVEVFNVDILEL